MSAPKHTPGPWFRDQYGHVHGWEPTEYGQRSVLLIDNRHSKATSADKTLIAAAPETAAERDRLREVNAELVAALEQIAHRAHKHAVCTQVQYSLGDIARAALAKATGSAS
jgi:hypothetical protein